MKLSAAQFKVINEMRSSDGIIVSTFSTVTGVTKHHVSPCGDVRVSVTVQTIKALRKLGLVKQVKLTDEQRRGNRFRAFGAFGDVLTADGRELDIET